MRSLDELSKIVEDYLKVVSVPKSIEEIDDFRPHRWVSQVALSMKGAYIQRKNKKTEIDRIFATVEVPNIQVPPLPGCHLAALDAALQEYGAVIDEFFSESHYLLKKQHGKSDFLSSFFRGENDLEYCYKKAPTALWVQHLEVWLLLQNCLSVWFLTIKAYYTAALIYKSHKQPIELTSLTADFLSSATNEIEALKRDSATSNEDCDLMEYQEEWIQATINLMLTSSDFSKRQFELFHLPGEMELDAVSPAWRELARTYEDHEVVIDRLIAIGKTHGLRIVRKNIDAADYLNWVERENRENDDMARSEYLSKSQYVDHNIASLAISKLLMSQATTMNKFMQSSLALSVIASQDNIYVAISAAGRRASFCKSNYGAIPIFCMYTNPQPSGASLTVRRIEPGPVDPISKLPYKTVASAFYNPDKDVWLQLSEAETKRAHTTNLLTGEKIPLESAVLFSTIDEMFPDLLA